MDSTLSSLPRFPFLVVLRFNISIRLPHRVVFLVNAGPAIASFNIEPGKQMCSEFCVYQIINNRLQLNGSSGKKIDNISQILKFSNRNVRHDISEGLDMSVTFTKRAGHLLIERRLSLS